MAGIGTGVVLTALATGASGPGTGTFGSFENSPAGVPFGQGVSPNVDSGGLDRPVSSSGLPPSADGQYLSWTDIPPAALQA